MPERIYSKDLAESGPAVQMLFEANFPDGLTPEEMEHHELGWVRRAFERWKEAHVNGNG